MENRLEHLNQVNDVPVHSVLDPEFASYGRVVTGYDFSEMIAYMEQNTPIPENGNIYVASVPEMEALAVSAEVQKKFYGDMPIEVGYCNGRNTTWNGFEYHKGSEINVAVTDFMLILGHVWQIEDNTYRFENAKSLLCAQGHGGGDVPDHAAPLALPGLRCRLQGRGHPAAGHEHSAGREDP